MNNPLVHAARELVQGGTLMGVMTVFFLLFFVAWALWAYHPNRKHELDEAARMPFSDGGEL